MAISLGPFTTVKWDASHMTVFFATKLNFSEKSECQTIEKSEKKCCSIDDINNNNLVFPGELG